MIKFKSMGKKPIMAANKIAERKLARALGHNKLKRKVLFR